MVSLCLIQVPSLIRQGAAGDLHEGQTREDRQGLPLINKRRWGVQEDAPQNLTRDCWCNDV